MKQSFRHIAIYLLTCVVLIASTGLNVHHLYCMCKGESVAYLFPPNDPCEEMTTADICCKKDICEAAKKGQHDCSNCQSEYVSLDSDYLINSSDLKVNVPTAALIRSFTFPVVEVVIADKISWDQDIPPPAGNALLPWLQSYLC